MARLKAADISVFYSPFIDRWNSLKNSYLSVETIKGQIDEYESLLENTGAFSREQKLWPEKLTEPSPLA